MNIHHIGYAVKSIDKSLPFFSQLGFEISNWGGGLTVDVCSKVNILFIQKGEYVIELISPISENSPVDKILEKNGVTPYHICYEVDNLDETCRSLRQAGYLFVQKPAPAPAIGDTAVVAFLYHPSVGLIELVSFSNGISKPPVS